MSAHDALFQPMTLGHIELANRMAMAPMTRHRCTLDGVPTALCVEYYRQRAGAGLIITEGTYPSETGRGYLFTPGLCTAAQVAGWRQVTEAVHQAGGRIFCQIMHCGRLSDPLLQPGQALPVAPSAVQPDPTARHYTVHCPRPRRPYPVPRALTTREVHQVVAEYRRAMTLALEAGFDGVEIHAASGYLPMQFLSTNTNRRDDDFGGSIENRARFLLACVDAMSDVAGPGHVAVKVSPGWHFHDVFDDDPQATYRHVAQALSPRGIAYLHAGNFGMDWDVYGMLREQFAGPLMVTGGFNRRSASALIARGGADLVAFGKAYIANPDLDRRYREGLPVNRPEAASYYTQGEQGFSDYPCFEDSDPAWQVPADDDVMPVADNTSYSFTAATRYRQA